MATQTLDYRFRLRRRTAASWTSLNEVLLDSEMGLESDTRKVKIGDGTTAWNALPYFQGDRTGLATLAGAETFAIAGGTADALTASFTPAVSALVDGQQIKLRATATNATTTPTLKVGTLAAVAITKTGNQPLVAGDIARAGHELLLRYVAGSAPRWELLNPASSTGGGSGGITDAPSDGQTYGRKNGAWVVVGSSSGSGVTMVAASGTSFTTGTSQAQTIPSGAQAGDLLLASIMHRDTLTAPSGWTLVARAGPVATPAQYTSIYKRTAVAGDGGTSTTWTQASSQRIAVHIQVLRKTGGCDVLASQVATVNGTGGDSFAFTTPAAVNLSQMLVSAASMALASTSASSTMAASSGWSLTTPSSSSDTANAIRLAVAYEVPTATGPGSGTFTSNAGSGSTNSWVSVTALIG